MGVGWCGGSDGPVWASHGGQQEILVTSSTMPWQTMGRLLAHLSSRTVGQTGTAAIDLHHIMSRLRRLHLVTESKSCRAHGVLCLAHDPLAKIRIFCHQFGHQSPVVSASSRKGLNRIGHMLDCARSVMRSRHDMYIWSGIVRTVTAELWQMVSLALQSDKVQLPPKAPPTRMPSSCQQL